MSAQPPTHILCRKTAVNNNVIINMLALNPSSIAFLLYGNRQNTSINTSSSVHTGVGYAGGGLVECASGLIRRFGVVGRGDSGFLLKRVRNKACYCGKTRHIPLLESSSHVLWLLLPMLQLSLSIYVYPAMLCLNHDPLSVSFVLPDN